MTYTAVSAAGDNHAAQIFYIIRRIVYTDAQSGRL